MLAGILRSTARLLGGFAVEFDVDVSRGGEVRCERYEDACVVASRGLNCWGKAGMGTAC